MARIVPNHWAFRKWNPRLRAIVTRRIECPAFGCDLREREHRRAGRENSLLPKNSVRQDPFRNQPGIFVSLAPSPIVLPRLSFVDSDRATILNVRPLDVILVEENIVQLPLINHFSALLALVEVAFLRFV
jgi:hypothetical protein